MTDTPARLIAGAPGLWASATRAAFLDGIADGTLPDADFDRWLEQDRLFVQALVRAWGLLLTTAPHEDYVLLASGISGFADELVWFEEIAARRGLDLSARALPAARAYSAALIELATQPYPVAITGMWAVEAAYLASWQGTLPAAVAYREYAEHWAGEGFAGFVEALADVVRRELPDGPTEEAEDAFAQVALHEAAFWRMTTAGDPTATG